jgi:catechol 2,3-dioxygenase-like lactoylglutathione lyase family enzyme
MLTDAPICYLFLYVEDMKASRALMEEQLHFKPVEADDFAVKYPAGRTMLALNRAKDWGVDLSQPRTQALIVQHAGDVAAADTALADAGVKRGAIDRYSIGGTVEILDAERHGLMLYEPSAEALTWPSAAKIRAVMADETPDPSPGAHVQDGRFAMGSRPVIYTFLFVRSAEEAREFYQDKLGLKAIEVDDGAGVVKYDVGSFILATHAEDHLGKVGDPPRASAMASVFLVEDLDRVHQALEGRGVVFSQLPGTSGIGRTARFADPNGHVFFLYEPSEAAWSLPSGALLKQV